MKKMIRAGDDDDRQILRARPIHNGVKRNGIVKFAMDHERIRFDFRNVETSSSRRDQDHLPNIELRRNFCLHEAAKRKPSEKNGQVAKFTFCIIGQKQKIFRLATAFVVLAFARADAAKIHTQCHAIEFSECARERLNHFVFQRATVQRMRVRD